MSDLVDRIEEVVLVVKDQDKAVSLFEELFGFEFKAEWDMPMYEMHVKSAKVGDTQFQIVGSTNPDPKAFINRFLSDRGEGLHHIAFKTHNLEETVARLKDKGVTLIPEEHVGTPGLTFVHPESAHGLLIELF